jgi:hypothetical protein
LIVWRGERERDRERERAPVWLDSRPSETLRAITCLFWGRGWEGKEVREGTKCCIYHTPVCRHLGINFRISCLEETGISQSIVVEL